MFYKSIIDNIQTKQFEKELTNTDDIYKYLNGEHWSKLCDKSKKLLLIKIHKLVCECLGIKEDIDINFYFSKEKISGASVYDEKRILINALALNNNSGYQIYETIIHELTHIKQRIDLEYGIFDIIYNIYFKNHELLINFCDFKNVIGDFHIDAIQEIPDKSETFYHLIKPEREAYENAHILGKQINPESEDKMHEYYANFNKMYNSDLDKNEINKIIDSCFMHIYNRTLPDDKYKDLKANIMYDLCVIALLLKTKELEYVNYLITEIKEKSLNKYGYNMIFKKTAIQQNIKNEIKQFQMIKEMNEKEI